MGHMEVKTLQEAVVAAWMSDLGEVAEKLGSEDWQAGGAFPDIVKDLKLDKHIGDRLYIAGCRLAHDMQAIHGTSAGLVSRYGEYVASGVSDRLPARFGTDGDAFKRMCVVLGHLREHERSLLQFCIVSRELDRGKLCDWGRQNSGYATSKTARAAATGQIRSLLESIEEIYRSRVPREM